MAAENSFAEWSAMSDEQCPTRELLDRIGDRWTVLVIVALDGGPLRFNQLEKMIAGVSQKMLTQTLRSLERDGLVSRTVFPEVPPRVVYELTSSGTSLKAPLAILHAWATANIDGILEARRAYDEPPG